jgi:very-short-patch-repair endonuclease
MRKRMNLPEVLLWKCLKSDNIGFRIKRQYASGPYIYDFYCANPKVNIELDGSVHEWERARDQVRDEWSISCGVTVIRISAKAVLTDSHHVSVVLQDVLQGIQKDADHMPKVIHLSLLD